MLTIVGIGPGNKEYITYIAMKKIKESQVLIGAKRMLESFLDENIEIIDISIGLDNIIKYIKDNYNKKDITVLASGDTGFYSIASTLKQKLGENFQINIISGISSMQYFCSKLNICWNDIAIISIHGKQEDLIQTIKNNSKTFVLTGGKNSIEYICQILCNNNMGELEAYIGENLSYYDEKITTGKITELSSKTYSQLSVIIIINPLHINIITSGIPDSHFIRGNVPMTKEEVRAVSISKLQLSKDHIIYDIGAGTGSISIECAIHSKQVYAIEYNIEAIELIKLNIEKFNISNIFIAEGKAPDILKSLPTPDRVFIGGSNGNIKNILEYVINRNPKVRITINAILLETASQCIEILECLGYINIDIVQISIAKSKKVGHGNMLMAQNPIFIITAEK